MAKKKLTNKVKKNNLFTFELSFPEHGTIEYHLVKNKETLEIIFKLYVEIVTRKLGLPINLKYDVITKIYNSWYKLFPIIREDLRFNSAELIMDQNYGDLISLLLDILNLGLRPHLEKYQARFRMYYDAALKVKINIECTPQEIQEGYIFYEDLSSSMLEVNKFFICLRGNLANFINSMKKEN
jgi:hypothetical protein